MNIRATLCMSKFDICCRCNRFRSLFLLSDIVLRYAVFNCLIPGASLSALVDLTGEVAPKINNLRVLGKKSVSAKFKALIIPSGGSSKVKPGLPSTLFLVFDAPSVSSDRLFSFPFPKIIPSCQFWTKIGSFICHFVMIFFL